MWPAAPPGSVASKGLPPLWPQRPYVVAPLPYAVGPLPYVRGSSLLYIMDRGCMLCYGHGPYATATALLPCVMRPPLPYLVPPLPYVVGHRCPLCCGATATLCCVVKLSVPYAPTAPILCG